MAPMFGVRMRPLCPHCCDTAAPCMDAFGSCAEAMGGIAGRSDGIAGAVECQKSSGSLHLHFWNYVQRAHQFHSLAEIAGMLEKALISASQLKAFCEHLCCESYPVTENLSEEVESLERDWPCFKETGGTTSEAPPRWGESRVGRIAPFVWRDSGPDYCSLPLSAQGSVGSGSERSRLAARPTASATPPRHPSTSAGWLALVEDAAQYQSQFNRVLQDAQKCAQHHIHPKSRETGQRMIPNACLGSKGKGVCKHDFPMVSRMNPDKPLVVCRGIAKSRLLPWRGRRSVLGQILGQRNNEWLNGTAPGLCIALSGGNSDVAINDLLPVIACTHEASACARKCIPAEPGKQAASLRRMIRTVARTQAQRNGYFGGYISKRQKVGKLEARKCIEKMKTLRAGLVDSTPFKQQRGVSGRMVTDIEMNGTLRGAVEEFNLCINLTPQDALFAECIRSFPTVTLDARQWLNRLEVELTNVADVEASVFVPMTRKPHVRSLAAGERAFGV